MKKSLAILMAAMMAVTAAGCGSKQEETTAAQTTEAVETGDTTAAPEDAETEAEAEGEETAATGGVLTMGTNAEFPPYEYYEGGDIVGIDVEIMAAVAKEMGMELQVEDMAFDSIIPAISSGKVDVGAAGMTVTEERQASVDFTNTYAKASQMIIVKDGSEIAGPADLEGKVIGVQLGTTGDLYCTDPVSYTHLDVYKRQSVKIAEGISCSRRISLFQSKVNYRVAVFSKAGSVKRTGFCLKAYPGNIVFLRHWMQNFSHLDCYVKT